MLNLAKVNTDERECKCRNITKQRAYHCILSTYTITHIQSFVMMIFPFLANYFLQLITK